jgi:mannose PTS system EIIA component
VTGKASPLVVLAGHGAYAGGALDAIEMILGAQEDVHAVGMNPDQDPSQVVEEVRALTEGCLGTDEGRVLLLVDLFGGSPANALAAAFAADSRVELVSGLNLPMVLELLVQRGRPGVDLKEVALSAGRTGVVDIGARLRKPAVSEEARDGHE